MNVFNFQDGCIVGKSKPIKQLFNIIPQLARDTKPILIQGESGTGKELFASAIHSTSPRSLSPFVKVNCASLQEPRIELDLFGCKKSGAGRSEDKDRGLFELAGGGTILLDQINSLPALGQKKLLQVLKENKFFPVGAEQPVTSDVRVIATSKTDLWVAVEQGKFNQDLYAFLKPHAINLPVLRRLREDIPLLVNHFIAKYSRKYEKDVRGISMEALGILMEYDWPGNVRELEDCIEQAVIIERLQIIQAHSLPYDLLEGGARQRLVEEYNLRRRLRAFERQLILRALNEARWKKKEAAGLLGIDQRNLSYFLRKHHITDPETRIRERGSL